MAVAGLVSVAWRILGDTVALALLDDSELVEADNLRFDQSKQRLVEADVDLLTFTRERIAGYKCPRTIDFADDLPRLPTGKIQRRLVRDPYWAGRDKSI